MKTILILNGPPSCGKDTLADYLKEQLSWAKVEFKEALAQDVCTYFGVSHEQLKQLERQKETPTPWLVHPTTGVALSKRQAYIHVSEDIMKPKHGLQHYGQRLAQRILASSKEVFVCSDGGFDHEIIPLLEEGIRVRIVRIRRPGYTFENDSRNYIKDEFVLAASESGYDVHMVDFENADTYQSFVEKGMALALEVC